VYLKIYYRSFNYLEKGLSNYENVADLIPFLTQCLKDAENEVPEDVINSTPLFMKATAGMRMRKLK